jgi:hypothetical protein
MANQGTPHRNGNGNYNRDYDRDRDFISRQGRDRDDERIDESRDDDRYAMSRNVRDMRDPEREAYDRNNFGPTYSGSGSGRGQRMGNRDDDDRGYGRSYDHERYGQRQYGPNYGQHGAQSSRGQGDWGQYDEGRVTYGRRGEGQGFRESTGYDAGREREPFGPQGGWNTEDRFGRRDEYQSNQDYGMRDREYGRGQSGYGSGMQREQERYGDWGRNDRPGRYGASSGGGMARGDQSWNQTGQGGRFGQQGYLQGDRNYGVGARDSERADRMQRSYRGIGPQGYSRSDQRIQEDVNDTFTDDHDLDAANITVKVQGGEVTLTGTVGDRHMKYRAEEIAERVTGVKEVDNQIRVQKQQEQRTSSRYEEHGSSTGSQHLGSSATGKTADDKANKPKPS